MGKGIKKLIILLLIFIAAIGLFMWQNRGGESERTYMKMEAATLPVIRLLYQERLFNELHGYTAQMEVDSMRETVYPLSEDRTIKAVLLTYGEEVTSVGYEVRSLDGTHLIERNETEEILHNENNDTTVEITLLDLLEQDQDYMVILTLYRDGVELADYYTRVRSGDVEIVSGAIDFALEFSDKTFLDEPDEVIIAQLESKPGADNTNLGYTNIYSSYSHVLWGNLHPERCTETRITLYEFDRLMTSLVLSYGVTAEGEDGETETYEVKEFYCVRYVGDKYYLMTYERLVDQRFEQGDLVIEDGALLWGIVGEAEPEMQTVQQGSRTLFVQDKRLRCYDSRTKELKTLFSFSGTGEDLRTGYDQHDIRIIRAEDNGDVEFLVYGYMNCGPHEGQSGIAYYRYLAEEDALEEIFYIPSGQNYQRLKEELGVLSYRNDSGLFYLMYKGTIYAIDIEGGEYVQLASNVRSKAVAIDEKNGVVAWQEGDSDVSETITVYYLASGESRSIKAPEGEMLQLMGFIGGDLLYGLVSESDWAQTHRYSMTCPIHALEIVNMDGQLERRYEQDGVYLTDIIILEDRISFGRQHLTENGWVALDGDVLFCKGEETDVEESLLTAASTERQKRIYWLDLGLAADTAIKQDGPKWLEAPSRMLNLAGSGEKEDDRYFAYSHGRLQGIFDAAADAIACIEADMGVVVDHDQNMVWNRGNRGSSAEIKITVTEPVAEPQTADYLNLFLKKLGSGGDCSDRLASGENIFAVLEEFSERELVNLEGCSLDQILFYLYEGVPVLGINGQDKAVLLTGYYELYGDLTLIYYDLETAKAEEVSEIEAGKWFSASGNRFFSAIP